MPNNAVLDAELIAKPRLLATAQVIEADPKACYVHAGNSRDLSHANAHINSLTASMAESGQLEAAVGRPCPSDPDRIELLKGACRLEAVRQLNANGDPRPLIVLLLTACDDTQAWEIITAEQVRTKGWSAWEMAAHLDRLHGQFGSNKAIHRRFGLDPANIGRTRKVTALPAAVLDLIQDRHVISARRASIFMSAWEKPAARRKLEKELASLARAYPDKLAADALFDALDATISRPAKIDTTPTDDVDATASKAVGKAAVASTGKMRDIVPKTEPTAPIPTAAPGAPPRSAASLQGPARSALIAGEQYEDDLVRAAEADDMRQDIVGADDRILGYAIRHGNGTTILRLAPLESDYDVIRAAGLGAVKAMLRLHGFEPRAK